MNRTNSLELSITISSTINAIQVKLHNWGVLYVEIENIIFFSSVTPAYPSARDRIPVMQVERLQLRCALYHATRCRCWGSSTTRPAFGFALHRLVETKTHTGWKYNNSPDQPKSLGSSEFI